MAARGLCARTIFGSARCNRFSLRRGYCSTSSQNVHEIPMTIPLPGMPIPRYATVTKDSSRTEITTLDNGLRVASANKFGQFCTVGVLINSGSRYEADYPGGVGHLLEKLAFTSTQQYDSRESIMKLMETHGGILDCQGSRDTLIYACSVARDGLAAVVDLLADVTLTPRITDSELRDARNAITFQMEMVAIEPDPEPLLQEMIHSAAFNDNTLGAPRFCPADHVASIDRSTLLRYMKQYHTPERVVVAGVGVNHQELVSLVEKNFLRSPTWQDTPLKGLHGVDSSVAQYTGGQCLQEKNLSNVSLGPNPMPELAHLCVGLESVSHQHEDFIPVCVLNSLLGGGGSFSAGGPGKGMYTRLYVDVLNRHHWIHHASAMHHSYQDSGIFGIQASCHPTDLWRLAAVVVGELVRAAHGAQHTELCRAKTQLQSMLLMNLEARPVIFEDIGRQVLASGRHCTAEYYYDRIGDATCQDIARVSQRMLESRVSVAALGSLANLPSITEIQAGLVSGGMTKQSKLKSFFR